MWLGVFVVVVIFAFVCMATSAIYNSENGTVAWKGRNDIAVSNSFLHSISLEALD